MPKEDNRPDHPATGGSKAGQAQFAEAGKRIGDATLQAQNEFFKTLEEMSRDILACTTTQFELSLKLSRKLSSAHTVPDAMAAYQEWLSEGIDARAEDARRFMTNGQKFMDTGTRLFSNGFSGVGSST
jgi:hypothetical protein